MSTRTSLIRLIRHWHARVGALAALFFLLLATTGMALNHTHALGLDSRMVSATWLTHWYGLKADENVRVWPLGNDVLIATQQDWLMHGAKLAEHKPVPVGVVEYAGVRYVATPHALELYLPDGQLVEKLDATTLPGTPIHRLGRAGNRVVLETGTGIYAADERLEWQRHATDGVAWSVYRRLTPAELSQWSALLAPTLALEKIVLDIHSGRIFGAQGPLLMDAAAVVLMILSLSGLWIYFRSIRKRPV